MVLLNFLLLYFNASAEYLDSSADRGYESSNATQLDGTDIHEKDAVD